MIKVLVVWLSVVFCCLGAITQAEDYPKSSVVLAAHDLREEGKFRKALKLYLEAADAENPEAMNAIGVMAMNGSGMTKNEARAFSYIKMAAELGYPEAQKNLAQFYEKGIRVKKNQDKADYWYSKYREQEKTEVANTEISVEQSSQVSNKVKIAVKHGDNDVVSLQPVTLIDEGAQLIGSAALKIAQGVTQDQFKPSGEVTNVLNRGDLSLLEEGAALMKKVHNITPAAKQISASRSDMTPSSNLREQKCSLEVRKEVLLEHLSGIMEMSEDEVLEGLIYLNVSYKLPPGTFIDWVSHYGANIDEDIIESAAGSLELAELVKKFRFSYRISNFLFEEKCKQEIAALNEAVAQPFAGKPTAVSGLIENPELETLLEKARLSIELTEVGIDYFYGRNGRTQDHSEAVKWFTAAAENGWPQGQSLLGVSYALGQGTRQDNVYAYMWNHIALGTAMVWQLEFSQQGSKDFADALEEVVNIASSALDTLSSKMTTTQISVARELANECISRAFTNC